MRPPAHRVPYSRLRREGRVQTYTLTVFDKGGGVSELRLLGPDDREIGSRPLDPAAVQQFATAIVGAYHAPAPQLALLGQRLYEWIDGPTERWLEGILETTPGLALRIDVDARLRHLPWELMQRGGVFVFANAYPPATPIRHVKGPRLSGEAANRPLRVLFMASSPEDVRPMLDFEDEEKKILAATGRSSLELVVEESGTLRGLTERLAEGGPGYYDVLHITGHATLEDGKPYFLLENDVGRLERADSEAIARACAGRWPRLVFLSGCRTGQAGDQGDLPSLCESLITKGAPAVLGWALPVGDPSATQAAAKLYGELALGVPIGEAVVAARQVLYDAKSPYWHLLRLYARPGVLPAVVTPLKHPGRAHLHRREADHEFLDVRESSGVRVPVCPRGAFVGRRRTIQRCLKVLRSHQGEDVYAEGVVLQGMGGLGKSSLAARLCERMPDHRRLVWFQGVDEKAFLRGFAALDDADTNALLNEPKLELQQRLRKVLTGPLSAKPVLFVFDDFEHNLSEATDEASVVKHDALRVLVSLLGAIRDTASESRVIVTSRYGFPLPKPLQLTPIELDALHGADREKKATRLPAMAEAAKELRERAMSLSAGNPRLMERLDTVLAEKGMDHAALFDALEAKTREFREELVLGALVGRLRPEGKKLLALMCVYEVPVARAAVDAIAGGIDVGEQLARAANLGLVEVGRAAEEAQYFVSPLLRPLLAGELSAAEQADALLAAVHHVYDAWWKTGVTTERRLEVHRLAMATRLKDVAVEVGYAIATSWVNGARYREALLLCEETLKLGDDYRIHHAMARAETILGDTTNARSHYEQALSACKMAEETDARERAHSAIVHNLADLCAQQGDVARALDLWKQSLAVDEKIGDVKGKAVTLHQMAGVIAQQGDVARALDLWKQSLAVDEKIGNVKGKAATLHNMAGVIAQQGDVARALDLWSQSLAVDEKIGNVKGKAATLHNMAGVIAQQGDVARALDLLKQALALVEKIGDVQGTAATLSNMAGIIAQQGDVARALDLWKQALALLEKIGDVQGTAATLSNMAGIIAQQGDVARALDLWKQALALVEKIGDVQGTAAALANMAWAAGKSGDLQRERALNMEAARLLGHVRAWLDLATVLGNLGAEDTPDAANFLTQALWLAHTVGVRVDNGIALTAVLLQKLTPAHPHAPTLAVAAQFLVATRGAQHPEQQKLLGYTRRMLGACVKAREIADQDFERWAHEEGLDDPQRLGPKLMAALDSLVPEGAWLFDRNDVLESR
ncbi:tetratricopeptide repeat protein [Polyangium sp. 6x1]|uniref:tetratricopeptide repeat protein n=1 Tax=Polyangium sp. 6x1 TaxID=3042689 RepID=UPI002482661D|nr:tetratricopeptide repeat protein [Polyangium sp. 6x1]MDI1445432.1 tetratricopeptide repeat protein [Polyangium sp. 6x1]